MSDVKEKLMNLTVAETVTYSITAVMAMIGVVSLVATAAKTGSYRDKLFMMESQRTQLKGQLQQEIGDSLSGSVDEAAAESAGASGSDDNAEDIIVTGKGSAQSAGVSVANFQNRYIPASLDRADGILSSDSSARSNAYNMTLPYFLEGYESFADSWYDPQNRYQNGTSNNFMWEFNSKYSFEGSQLPVIWTCRHVRGKGVDNADPKNEVVAYATGIYDLNTGKFSGMHKYITTAGKPMSVGYSEPGDTVLPPASDSDKGLDVIEDDLDSTESVSDNDLSEEQDDDLWGEEDDSKILETEAENEVLNNSPAVLDDGDNGGLPDNFFQ